MPARMEAVPEIVVSEDRADVLPKLRHLVRVLELMKARYCKVCDWMRREPSSSVIGSILDLQTLLEDSGCDGMELNAKPHAADRFPGHYQPARRQAHAAQ